ncbi:DUF2380 domain-containing protein [Paenibacillus wynnii]|uniref:Uncharacterized protein n=1 Tax=Paenibacillus wynnii TaxID=268407 RepID=A0A098M5X6_9BACL|nr:DUF2380 domain-containing protein [Paenibacillus wynnii]KGE17426.1 hypothetical protein PWYN_22745 [Paenibacillus wynnii]
MNLRRLYGWDPSGKLPDGTLFNAHHIFPQEIFDKLGLGTALKNAGISIHDPRLMVWWERSDHLSNAHNYNEIWTDFLNKNPKATVDEIINKGKEMIQEYGFEVRF